MNKITKQNLLRWYSKKYCLTRVKRHGEALQFVKNQTEEICIEAIKQNPKAIQYVDIKRFPKVYELYQFLTL